MNAEVEYAIGRFMKVRKLAGTFQITDSWMVGGTRYKRRRYLLHAVKGTGAILNVTEAFADAMEPLPVGATAEELTLVPDPPAVNPSRVLGAGPHPAGCDCYECVDTGRYRGSQEHDAAPGHTEPAPDSAQPVAGAIFGPDGLDAGAFGGELDEYSVGARYADENPGELRNPYKSVRKFPRRPTYKELRGIVYNARFKGLEDKSEVDLSRLPNETPVAVVVTHETNGHGIWIITMDSGQPYTANLEIFYPSAPGSSADAVEYAVLLALRQVPIRTEDLEILLLELT